MAKNIEVYYAGKSKTLYVIMPDGESYFVTNSGKVGKTYGQRNVTVKSEFGGSMENARMVCELTPSVIRKLNKVLR